MCIMSYCVICSLSRNKVIPSTACKDVLICHPLKSFRVLWTIQDGYRRKETWKEKRKMITYAATSIFALLWYCKKDTSNSDEI